MDVPEKQEYLTIEWLNRIFNIKGIKVHDFTFTGEAGVGQGFMGTLEQVKLKISRPNADETTANESTETLYIILKTLPKDTFRRSYAANDGFSSREVCMYTEVFQKWDKFMDDRHVPLASRFSYPHCYYGAEEGEGDTFKYILVLEDLTSPKTNFNLWTAGFTEPLPWIKATAVIRQIARFHATGIAYKMENHVESYYEVFPKLQHFLSPAFKIMWDQGFAIVKEVIVTEIDRKDIPYGLFEQLDKLHGDTSRDLLMKWFTDPKMASGFGSSATICHHDLHSQNLVLSNDNSQAVLFDYQVPLIFFWERYFLQHAHTNNCFYCFSGMLYLQPYERFIIFLNPQL